MLHQLIVTAPEDEIIVDEGLPRDDTKQMYELLGRIAHVGPDGVAASGGVEDGEIDIGIGVCRVEEAAETYRFLGLPELENLVHVD